MTPQLVSQTREGEPEKLRRRLRGDLDNIVLKSLQKEPEQRYSTVEDFSRDLQRHLQSLPVSARPHTIAYRVRKFTQRHKFEVSATFAFTLILLAAMSFAVNLFGVRDRFLGVKSGRVRPEHPGGSFKTRGFVTPANASHSACRLLRFALRPEVAAYLNYFRAIANRRPLHSAWQ
jgi:serine/threonine protein kinase